MKPFIHTLMALSLVIQPSLTFAGNKEYNENCKGKQIEQDDVKAKCAEAKIAKRNRDLEASKVAIYAAATAVTTTLAAIENLPFSAAAAKTICLSIGLGVPASTMVADIVVAKKNDKEVDVTSQAMGSITSAGTSLMGTMLNGGLKSLKNPTLKGTSNGTHRLGCAMTAVGMAVSTAMSGAALSSAQKTFNYASDVASILKEDPGNQIDLNYAYNAGAGGSDVGKTNVPTGPSIDAMSVESCDSKSGKDYLKCMGQHDSDIAKMTSNPQFMDEMNKFLGQDLGDFAKNAPRDGDSKSMNDYVANALGLGSAGSDALGKLRKDFEKIAQDSDVVKYTPSSGLASGKSSSSDTLDFNSMLAGMLKQMNPDANVKKDEAAELAFRQMELLPAEKLMQNKDISLFARIGFRYRKSQNKLDSLNWALPQNQAKQSSENRAPAKN